MLVYISPRPQAIVPFLLSNSQRFLWGLRDLLHADLLYIINHRVIGPSASGVRRTGPICSIVVISNLWMKEWLVIDFTF